MSESLLGGNLLALVGSILVGVAVFIVACVAHEIFFDTKALAKKRNNNAYERSNDEKLRASSGVIRCAESLVRELAKLYESSPGRIENEHYLGFLELKENVQDPPHWTAPLFYATRLIESAISGCGVALVTMIIASWFTIATKSIMLALLVGVFVAVVVYYTTTITTINEGKEIKKRVTRSLPFVVDLMALTRGAGASFTQSLEIVVEENRGTPIGRVFECVLRDLKLGKSQREVMDNLRERMDDWDFSEFVFTVNRGEELGVSIVGALATLANQMRLKRQQWLEQEAGRAQARILTPGIIVMIACMIIELAPFGLMWLNKDALAGGFFAN